MKSWQPRLMIVVLLTLAFTLFVSFDDALFLVPIVWLLGRKVANSTAREGPLKAAVRFAVASLAAVGFSVVTMTVWVRPLSEIKQSVVEIGPISFTALSGLLLYWLAETYAVVPLEGVGRTIFKAFVSLILASFAAFGFAIVFVLASFMAQGAVNLGWTAWLLLCLSFVLPLYATWKLLPQNNRR